MFYRILFLILFIFYFSACGGKKNTETTISDTTNVENNPLPAEELEEIQPESNAAVIAGRKSQVRGHEQNAMAFSDLKTASPQGFEDIFVFYNPEKTQILNQKDTASQGEPSVILLKTMLDEKQKDIFTIKFNPGLSNDPMFTISKSGKEIANLSARELIIPGNGTLYTTGHVNAHFDERRKFQLKDGRIKEVKQPFLYVGLQTKTTASITIYTANDFKQTLAVLPKGTEIEVLVNTGKNYLIRTPFGLTGWWKNNAGKKTPIEGLEYAGD
ncbi:MAG: hypothetical protein H7Y04_12595 [Verrucomicrobia bacterium]|nr:hypothetical protein [Cytophagales bacterium]